MSEKIIIKNFGGLQDIEFEFKAINILIGQQASGKSVVAKLMYFFKDFVNDIKFSSESENYLDKFKEIRIKRFLQYFPENTWHKEDFEIQYILNRKYQIHILRKENEIININYSENIINLINIIHKLYEQSTQEKSLHLSPNSLLFHTKVEELVKKQGLELLDYRQVFIPAGRSFYAQIQNNIFSLINQNVELDTFLVQFGSFYEQFRNIFIRNNAESQAITDILSSQYLRENNKDYLVHFDNRKIELANASSAQQEVLPLLIMLETLQNKISLLSGATIYIEEPEAHLFPTAQKRIVEFMARIFNSKNNNFQIIITTHSPYILSSFNNLIEAGNIISENKINADEVYKIVPKEEVLNHEDFMVYSIKNGQKENLIDSETKLIDENILDEVSDEIAIEYDKLLDIKY